VGRRLAAAACMPLADLGLTPRARLVLVAMAVLAHDQADPPVYFGGWRYLAGALGYAEYGAVPERAVARAIAELRKSGVIVALGDAQPGRNVSYEIRLR
jgi:hypothetical protein